MSTGAHHYREAERLLTKAADFMEGAASDERGLSADMLDHIVAHAQVHATLALAAATAYPAIKDWCGDESNDSMDWSKVTAP